MTTVFDAFSEVDMTYLTVKRGQVRGNEIIAEKTIRGIFKVREGMIAGSQEVRQSTATVHAHPEDFAEGDEIVGNGIRYDGKEYAIIGMTEGRNFETNQVEHIKLTLERQNYVGND